MSLSNEQLTNIEFWQGPFLSPLFETILSQNHLWLNKARFESIRQFGYLKATFCFEFVNTICVIKAVRWIFVFFSGWGHEERNYNRTERISCQRSHCFVFAAAELVSCDHYFNILLDLIATFWKIIETILWCVASMYRSFSYLNFFVL